MKNNNEQPTIVPEKPAPDESMPNISLGNFAVPKGEDWYSQVDQREYGEVQRITYKSSLTAADKHANIVLPVNYNKNSTNSYPVLYLLHGLTGNENSWLSDSLNAKYIVQNLHEDLGVPEMIIVCVNSIVNETEKEPAITSSELTSVYDKTGQDIVENIMPYVNENYRVLQGKKNTAIAGYSMGGREALLTAFKYQEKFGYVGALSSAPFGDSVITNVPNVPDFSLSSNSAGFEFVLICVGGFDTLINVTIEIAAKLKSSNIEHSYYIVPFGSHLPPVWRNGLYNFAKRIFI